MCAVVFLVFLFALSLSLSLSLRGGGLQGLVFFLFSVGGGFCGWGFVVGTGVVPIQDCEIKTP